MSIAVMAGLLLAAPAFGHAAEPSPGVDIGSKTSGLGLGKGPVAQPSPQPSIDARPGALPSGSGLADTPGKTGLGYPDDGARRDPGSVPGAPPNTAPKR